MHRFILNLKGRELADHINHNILDHRLCNLRKCTHAQNQMNRKVFCKKISKYLGVSIYIVATITVNGKSIHLGHFKTEEDAAHAYDEAAKKYHGEFANLNFK